MTFIVFMRLWVQSQSRALRAKEQGLASAASLIIHGLHICKFTYLLRFVCDPHISSHGAFMVIATSAKTQKIGVTHHAHSQVRLTKVMFCLLF